MVWTTRLSTQILMLVWTLERWRREKREGKEENIQRRKEFNLIVSLPSSDNKLYLTSFNVHRVVGCVNNLLVQTMFNVYQRLVQSTCPNNAGDVETR